MKKLIKMKKSFHVRFVSNWAHGLQVYMTRKHEHIEQVDGNIDSEDFVLYLETDCYWKTGILGTIFQIPNFNASLLQLLYI